MLYVFPKVIKYFYFVQMNVNYFIQNNDSEILWSHINDLYEDDSRRELRRTRLTAEHVHLTPQSIMRVYLAAQVS